MTAGKITIVLAIAASIKLLSAQDEALDKQTLRSLSVLKQTLKNLEPELKNLEPGQRNFESALTGALSLDLDRVRNMPSSSSPEERHKAFVEVMIRNGTLSHDAIKYLQASTEWRQELLRGGWSARAEDQTVMAGLIKVDACALAAVAYTKTVSAYGDALRNGQTGEAELQRVPAARKRLLDAMAAEQ
jgi:hypothetical protein